MGKSRFSMVWRSRATEGSPAKVGVVRTAILPAREGRLSVLSTNDRSRRPGRPGLSRVWRISPPIGVLFASGDEFGRGLRLRRRGRVELSPEIADLVAELGRVLEAQVLGGGEHLLLELDDRRLDLRRGHVRLA